MNCMGLKVTFDRYIGLEKREVKVSCICTFTTRHAGQGRTLSQLQGFQPCKPYEIRLIPEPYGLPQPQKGARLNSKRSDTSEEEDGMEIILCCVMVGSKRSSLQLYLQCS